jgi:TetR/AcrR family transcriptional repressor of lmrAB and yxaGH operons
MSNMTRQKILATTSNLLERQGYHATGLNQIVKESATPRGSLYYYFPDGKEELAAEAVTQRMKAMAAHTRQFLGQIDDPVEAIHALIVDISQKIAQQSCGTGAPIAAVALEASNTSERIRKACADGYQGLQDVIAAKLVMGGFSAEKAATLAGTINASIEGAIIISRTKQDVTSLVNVANDMKTLLQIASKA